MSDTKRFRVVQGSVYANGRVHGADEEVDLDPDAAEAMNADLEPVDAAEDEDEEDEDAPLVDRDPEQLTETERRIDAAEYQTLRQVAGRLEDVDGRGSEDELRVALHTDADNDRVDEAFAAVKDDEDGDTDGE